MRVSEKADTTSGINSLSRRQKEILRLVARHNQFKEIARLLKISEATVRTHTEEARRRLDVATTREAALALLRHESVDGSVSDGELLPDAPGIPLAVEAPVMAPPFPVREAAALSAHAAAEIRASVVTDRAASPVKPETTSPPKPTWSLSGWLRERSLLECVGVILLLALGLTFVFVALVSSSAAMIEAIQRLTGQTQ